MRFPLLDRLELARRVDFWARRCRSLDEDNRELRSQLANLAMVVNEQERKLDRVRELEHQVAELAAQRDALERENAAATRRAEKLDGLLAKAAAAFENPDRLLDLATALRAHAHAMFARVGGEVRRAVTCGAAKCDEGGGALISRVESHGGRAGKSSFWTARPLDTDRTIS